ncbi:MAG: response regulator transcription factor [Ardenticatenaceae bacterium]|nr:response regulator transcription factor [Ardenticatenaceae bacterium]
MDREEDVYVVGCATSAEELRFLLPHGNVVLLGLEFDDATTLDILPEIHLTYPDIKAIILGVNDSLPSILPYIEAGACGYILQEESTDKMVEKLVAAHEDRAIISPAVAAALMERISELASQEMSASVAGARETQFGELTSRQQEVLELITKGYTNRDIATELVIECGTVKNHVHNILKKLEVSSRQEAATVFRRQQPAVFAAV